MLERVTWPAGMVLSRHFAVNSTAWPLPPEFGWAHPSMVLDYTNGKPTVWMEPDFMSSNDMKRDGTIRNRLLYRLMRVLAGLMTLFSGLVFTIACCGALLGHHEMLLDFIDDDASSLVMTVPTQIAIVISNLVGLTALGLLFFGSNRFLNHAERGELLVDSARNALRRLGLAMVLIYVTTRLLALVIPILGIPGFWEDNGIIIPLTFVDMDFLYILVGVVLLVLGQALREGQAAKEEAKQYV